MSDAESTISMTGGVSPDRSGGDETAGNGGSAGPLLLVCSSGGHLLQMMELHEAWEGFDRVWVTFNKSDAQSLLRDEKVIHAFGPTNRNIGNMFRNFRLARTVIRSVKPAAILTTGAGVAMPFAWVGRLHSTPTVYVESVTRIDELSLTARLIAPVAARRYVQWPELSEKSHLRFVGNVMAGQ